jgi:hypothetical protein
MMPLLIQGPKQPGNDIDVYLEPLVDDLMKLWHHGVRVWDEYKREHFTVKSNVIHNNHRSSRSR